MDGEKKKYDVFLSYSKKDDSAAEIIAHQLSKVGIIPWLDKWNLIPGDPWQPAIEDALDSSKTCAVLVGIEGIGPWQHEEMRAAIDLRARGNSDRFRVIPVLLPGAARGARSHLPYFLLAATWVEFQESLDDSEAFHRLKCGIQGIQPGSNRGPYKGECPYRGLEVFDVDHSEFFFGREALTGWLLTELRPHRHLGQENRFLGIVGPSGSGKSSVARAGLCAALKRGEIDGSERWPIIICMPGGDPLDSLTSALPSALSTVNLPSPIQVYKDLSKDETALHHLIRRVLESRPSEQKIVLLIDQFEEVFTLCDDECIRKMFIDNLLYATSVPGGQTIVILTLRADFYGRCADYPILAATLCDHQSLVGPMTDSELHRAIEKPAKLSGVDFEPGLVCRLVRDVKHQAGGLPLLQHALLEMWDHREGRLLTHAVYDEIGQVGGALERRADWIFECFTEQERQICRRVFSRLTRPGEDTEDTKRRVALEELMPSDMDEQRLVAPVIGRLVESRLLTAEGQIKGPAVQYVQVAHEALIKNWARLRNWIHDDRDFLLWSNRLRVALAEWLRNDSDEGSLLRGASLGEAEQWFVRRAGDLNENEQMFIRRSAESWNLFKAKEDALRKSEIELKLLSSQLLTAQEDERKRVSRDIHDRIGQSLSIIRFSLDRILQGMDQTTVQAKALNELLSVTQRAIDETRTIMRDLRPSILDDLGVIVTIGWFLRDFGKIYPAIHIEKDVKLEEDDVPEMLKIVIFRVMQEAFNNIAKHSKAELAKFTLGKSSGKIEITIEDDGDGFALDVVMPMGNSEKGSGIAGMKQRVEASHGSLAVQSIPGGGTRIVALWPITE